LPEALRIAEEKGLDLVNVAPNAKPPVCRIMDFGKFKYEQSKKGKEARRNQKQVTIKEVKVRPKIETHDLEIKTKNGNRFLQAGNKVKVTVMFRGREITHPDIGYKLCARIKEMMSPYGKVEKEPRVEGRNMVMIISPTGKEGK